MTRLTDALELMHTADHRWNAIQADGIEWVDYRLQSEAIREQIGRQPGVTRGSGRGFRPVFGAIQSRAAKPRERMTSPWRAWLRQPADSRAEADHPGMPTITQIRRGATWWMWSRDDPVTSNLGNEKHGSGPIIQATTLLRPAMLLPHAEFRYVKRTTVVGRRCLTLVARPIPTERIGEVAMVGLIGDLCRMAIDEERGVVLRLESWHKGSPVLRVKFNRIRFIEGFDDALLASPEPVVDAADALRGRKHFWRLDTLAAAAPHPIFVPARLEFEVDSFPGLWFHGASADIDEGDPTKGRYASVGLQYSITNAGKAGTLWIQESTTRFVIDEDKDWQQIDGVRGRSGGTGSQVRLAREGVFIHLECDVYSLKELAGLARSLERLPSEPPPLETVR